jgi:hypothetical protein
MTVTRFSTQRFHSLLAAALRQIIDSSFALFSSFRAQTSCRASVCVGAFLKTAVAADVLALSIVRRLVNCFFVIGFLFCFVFFFVCNILLHFVTFRNIS